MLSNLIKAQENANKLKEYIDAEVRVASFRGDNSALLELQQAASQVSEYLWYLQRHIFAVNKNEITENNGGVV